MKSTGNEVRTETNVSLRRAREPKENIAAADMATTEWEFFQGSIEIAKFLLR